MRGESLRKCYQLGVHGQMENQPVPELISSSLSPTRLGLVSLTYHTSCTYHSQVCLRLSGDDAAKDACMGEEYAVVSVDAVESESESESSQAGARNEVLRGLDEASAPREMLGAARGVADAERGVESAARPVGRRGVI